MDRELTRRELFRHAGIAGISLSALLDLAWQPATSAAQAPATPSPTPKIGSHQEVFELATSPRLRRPTSLPSEVVIGQLGRS